MVLISDDEYFMGQALKEAEAAYEIDEVPVGAVVVINNKIISRGHNQVELLNDATAHAEILALTAAFNHLGSKYLPEATLYVTLEPCVMCSGALYWSKIGRIVWGGSDDKNGFRKFLKSPDILKGESGPFHPKTELVKGVMEDECAFIIRTFFKNKR